MSGLRRDFDHPPALGPSWLRALGGLTKRPSGEPPVPQLRTTLQPTRPEPRALAQYRALCGFADGRALPVTYPQVMAGPLHFHMVTDPSFPLPAAGVVHLRNLIEQRAPLASDAALAFECALKPAVRTHRGLEIDLETLARQDGQVVWRSVITFLSRGGGRSSSPREGRRAESSPEPGVDAAPSGAEVVARSVVWCVPEDTGRRYARIAGDFNPIHQHAVAARLFGFKRAIVHGMYTLARAAAECADDLPGAPFTLECAFKRPVFLPSTVLFEARRPPQGDAALTFEVRSGDTRCVEGRASVGV